jgi:hypothetical protein
VPRDVVVNVGRILTGVFPDETNTGIAAFGLAPEDLDPYSGFGSFDAEVTFSERAFLAANMANEYVRIDDGGHFYASKSYFDRRIDCDGPNRSLTLEDSTVDAGGGFVGVGFGNMTFRRCNVSNGNNCVNVSQNLLMEDCYIHHPFLPPGSADHINPLFWGGAVEGTFTVRRSTFWAPIPDNEFGGGVSTNFSMFPDFGPVHDVLIEDCFIRWTHGAYGATFGWNPGKDFNDHPLNGTNVVVRNTVFERGPSGLCGGLGPVTSCPIGRPGFVWENNRFDDGTPIDPA